MKRLVCLAALALACSEDPPPPPSEIAGTKVLFDLEADLSQPRSFFDFPWPSTLRMTDADTPDVRGFNNRGDSALVQGLLRIVPFRRGSSLQPVGYFRFDAPLAPHEDELVLPGKDAAVFLVGLESLSAVPVVVQTLAADDYTPRNVLAIAPRPGFVLDANAEYAFVVMRALGDADGKPLGVPLALEQLKAGVSPQGAGGRPLLESFARLWTALRLRGLDVREVAAATVFRTGDPVADLAALSQRMREKYRVTIDGLKVDPDDGAAHDRYCELVGTVTYPQFQTGKPPFNDGGIFELDADGLPKKQRDETAPVTLTIPKRPMPAAGYPLALFFHGSGGLSAAVVDRGGVTVKGGTDQKGKGPGYVLAEHGIAMAGSAMPVNPERLPGAGETAYLNLDNTSSFPFTFQQGVIEQRLFLDALEKVEIDPSVLASCAGPSLPAGATKYRYDASRLVAQGQSMGGMYTNMFSAVEPRVKAAIPTGAGGYWSYFILKTSLVPGAADLLANLLGTPNKLSQLHPVLALLQLSWEPAEPMVYMRRIAKAPLAGHPARSIYEPVGKGDEYFPTEVYDAAVLAYGHRQAGAEVWPTMQDALALDGRQGVQAYPLKLNQTSDDGEPYTAAVVQFEGDGIDDPHAIYKQLDSVKYQYGCFAKTFVQSGVAVIPAIAPLGTPCPE